MKLIVCTMQRGMPNKHSCGNSGGLDLFSALQNKVSQDCLNVSVEQKKCLSLCLKGPNIQLLPEGKIWNEVSPDDAEKIVAYLKQCEQKL